MKNVKMSHKTSCISRHGETLFYLSKYPPIGRQSIYLFEIKKQIVTGYTYPAHNSRGHSAAQMNSSMHLVVYIILYLNEIFNSMAAPLLAHLLFKHRN